jgi:hypothetical protein
MGWDPTDIAPLDPDFASTGGLKSGDQPQGGGFAAARWPQDAEKFSLTNVEVNSLQGDLATKAFEYLMQLYVRFTISL